MKEKQGTTINLKATDIDMSINDIMREKQDSENNAKKINNNEKCNNIDVFYNEAQRLYGLAMNSIDSINNKALGIITLNAVILTFSSDFLSYFIGKLSLCDPIFILMIISYILLILSMIFSALSYKAKSYDTISLSKLHLEFYNNDSCSTKDQLCSNMGEAIDNINESQKNKKKFINVSIILVIIGIASLSIAILLSLLK